MKSRAKGFCSRCRVSISLAINQPSSKGHQRSAVISDPRNRALRGRVLAKVNHRVASRRNSRVLREEMNGLASQGGATLGTSFLVSLAIWTANPGVKTISDALNIFYGEDVTSQPGDGTPIWSKRAADRHSAILTGRDRRTPCGPTVDICGFQSF
jgi:hypothetical protein